MTTRAAAPGVEAVVVLSPDCYIVTVSLEVGYNLADCNSADPEDRQNINIKYEFCISKNKFKGIQMLNMQ